MKPRRLDRPPVLEALPAALRRDASPPARCTCSSCVPGLTEAERVAEQEVLDAWNEARATWCRANGYTVLELLRSERPRKAPSKKRAWLPKARRPANTSATEREEPQPRKEPKR